MEDVDSERISYQAEKGYPQARPLREAGISSSLDSPKNGVSTRETIQS